MGNAKTNLQIIDELELELGYKCMKFAALEPLLNFFEKKN